MGSVYVLWADMLGVRDEIKKLSGCDLKKLVVDWDNLVQTAKCKSGILKAEVQSFDACLAQAKYTDDGLKNMITFAQTLLEEGIHKKILVRGAIGVGYLHNNRVIAVAEGLHPVQQLEQESNWIGIACTFEFTVPDVLWGWDTLVKYPVPGKEDFVRPRPAVAWNVPCVQDLAPLILGRQSKEGDLYTWMMINKAKPAIQFAKYIEAARKGGKQKPCDPPPPQYVLDPTPMFVEKSNSDKGKQNLLEQLKKSLIDKDRTK